jgi:hypothetical protein
MKAYYEYEDGTYWAIRTEGNACFTANGSKYCDLYLDIMLNNDSVEEDLTRRRGGRGVINELLSIIRDKYKRYS